MKKRVSRAKKKIHYVRFRDKKGRFASRNRKKLLKTESYERITRKTKRREREFQRGKLSERIQVIEREILVPPPPPQEKENWRVIYEFQCSPPTVEHRVKIYVNVTIEERDEAISAYEQFIENNGCALLNVTLEKI